MPFTLLDDGFCDHPKVIRAGLEAVGLHTRIMSWCNKQLTGGHVPYEQDVAYAGSAQKAKRLRATLLEVGLRDACTSHRDCSTIHDWSDRNDDAIEIKAARDAEARRKREWRAQRRRAKDDRNPQFPDLQDHENVPPDGPGQRNGHVPDDVPDIPGTVPRPPRTHARTSPLPPHSHPTSSSPLVNPPESGDARANGRRLEVSPDIHAARRVAAGPHGEPMLDGWHTEATVDAEQQAAHKHHASRDTAHTRLVALARMPETRGPFRLVDAGGWNWAGEQVAEQERSAARERRDRAALAESYQHAERADHAASAAAERRAALARDDPNGWQTALEQAEAQIRTNEGDLPELLMARRAATVALDLYAPP